MKRGEVWAVAGGGDFAGKPRPAVILQDDRFDVTDSVTICLFTTDSTEAPLFRVEVEASDLNGLDAPSRLMADKIVNVRRGRLGERLGRLDAADMLRLEQAVLVFLGFAGAPNDA